ncbi:MAG: integrase [Bacteroidetes bacterium 4572_77]|nr:MAG: integrase [Bacteroidetes bacterium 4572_77]
MTPHIQQFLDHLQYEKRYSKHTLISYKTDLYQFSTAMQENYALSTITDINEQMIRTWLADYMEKGITAKTINRKLSTIKSFFKFLNRQGNLKKNIAAKLQGPKQKKRLPIYMEEQKMDLLFQEEIDPDDYTSYRDYLIMELFYATGIRRAELINLQTHHVDIASKQIKVLGKRNKERIIPILDYLTFIIERYKTLREKQFNPTNTNNYFFLTKKGEKMYPKLVYRLVNSYLSRVSTQDKKSPHVLRHTFATHMLNNGANLNAVKELLGHSSLAATQIYTHNTIEKLKKVYQQAHPKA